MIEKPKRASIIYTELQKNLLETLLKLNGERTKNNFYILDLLREMRLEIDDPDVRLMDDLAIGEIIAIEHAKIAEWVEIKKK